MIMTTVKHQAYRDELTYEVDYLVDQKEYSAWKERLTNQLLKSVEVPGFRKGKAPYKLAMKHINSGAFEKTLLQETVVKFYPEAMKAAQVTLEKDKRAVHSTTVASEEDATGEKEDGTFQLRLVVSLVPQVDLAKIKKLKVAFPKVESIKDRPSKDEMVKKEKNRFLAVYNEYKDAGKDTKVSKGDRIKCDIVENGTEKKDQQLTFGTGDYPEDFEKALLGSKKGDTKEFKVTIDSGEYTFKVDVNEVLRPTYSSFKAVLENNKNAQDQFESEEAFEKKIVSYFDTESEKLLRDKWQSEIIQSAVDTTPKFALPSDRVNSEVDRIIEVIQNDGVQKGISLSDAFELSGIPAKKPVKTDKDLRESVTVYVEREFKWTGIIDAMYHEEVEKKFSPEQVKEAAKQIKENKAQYNIPDHATDEYIEDVAFDRLKRYTASHWLFDQVEKNNTKTKTKKELEEVAAT